jgi:hypothetical protein
MLLFYACQDKQEIDTPQVVSYTVGESAYMADSIPLGITVDGKYDMNSVRILFFINDEKISETLIPTNKAGSFATKLYVPYAKDVADGTAELQIVPRNKNFNYSVKTIPINIIRPKFPFLVLKTAYGDYQMNPVPGEPYKYSVTSNFPTRSLNALIQAPAYGDNGNAFYFGGTTIVANASEMDSISFKADPSLGANYTVSFDTRTFEAGPFLKPAFGGSEFPAFNAGMAIVEHNFTQNQAIAITGIADISDWWIDPTFLDKATNGYKFRAIDGKYRITADQNLKYFKIEPMNGNGLADFDPATKAGGVWINGGIGALEGSAPAGRLGIPSMTTNPSLWNADKNIAMAPKGNGIYEVKLIANQTLFLSNVSGSTAGISFYQNSRSKDNAFALELVQSLYGSPGSPSTSGGSARFELKPASANSNGDMICSGSNRSLGNGRTYVFSIDTKSTPAKISISLE